MEDTFYISCFYIIISILISAILRQVEAVTKFEERISIIIFGFVVGYFSNSLGFMGEAITYIYFNVDINMIALILFPTLVFLNNFLCDAYILKKEIINGLIISFPCLFVNIIILGLCFKYTYGSDFTFLEAINVGAMLAPAAPGIFVAKLTSMGIGARYVTILQLIQAFECVFGLSVCKVILKIIQQQAIEGEIRFFYVIGQIFGLYSASIISGIMYGTICSYWIGRSPRDSILINTIIIGCISVQANMITLWSNPWFGGFSIGISTMSAGLVLGVYGKSRIKKVSVQNVIHLFKTLSWMMESVLNMLVGNQIAIFWKKSNRVRGGDFFGLLADYWQRTLFYGSFFYAVSIVVNSIISTERFINWMGLEDTHQYKQKAVEHLKQKMNENYQERIALIKQNKFMQLTDWDYVEQMVKIDFNPLPQFSIKNVTSSDDFEDLLAQGRYNVLIKIKSAASILLEDQRSSFNTYRSIEQACNMCQDDPTVSINLFEILKLNFQQTFILEKAFKLKNVPIIGTYIKHLINKHISNVYEICIQTGEALKAVCLESNEQHIFTMHTDEAQQSKEQKTQNKSQKLMKKRVHFILIEEMRTEIKKVDDYIQELYQTYKEILKSLQTRLAILILTNFCLSNINNAVKKRQLSYRDSRPIVKHFIAKQRNLNIIQHNIDLQDVQFFGIAFPLIQQLNVDEVNILRQGMFLKEFKKNEVLFTYNQKMEYAYFLVNGVIEETICDQYIQKRSIGHLVGISALLEEQKSLTEAVAKSNTQCQVLLISQIQKILKINKNFRRKIYRKILFPLILNNPKNAQPLDKLNEGDLTSLSQNGTLNKFQKDETVSIRSGAFIFKGHLTDRNGQHYYKNYFIPPILQTGNDMRKTNVAVQAPQDKYIDVFYVSEKSLVFIFCDESSKYLLQAQNNKCSIQIKRPLLQHQPSQMYDIDQSQLQQQVMQPYRRFVSLHQNQSSIYEKGNICEEIDTEMQRQAGRLEETLKIQAFMRIVNENKRRDTQLSKTSSGNNDLPRSRKGTILEKTLSSDPANVIYEENLEQQQ